MILRIVLTLLVIALVAGGIAALRHSQDAARQTAMAGGPPPATVTATRVEETPWVQRIEEVGDLNAIDDVNIASEVPGTVAAINFESGAPVKAGQVLVRLDATEETAQRNALRAELKLAALELERITRLRRTPAFSQSLLDKAQSEMARLTAQVERQAALVQRKTLRAPFDGILSIRQVSLGTIVAPGDPIVRLQSLDPIYVDFTVSERHRGQIQPGQALEISVAAWPGEVFKGELIVVSPDVNLRTRTLKLRGQLANRDQRLQPGMFATVHLILSGAEPVLTLPRTAVSFFAYGESVFTIKEAGVGLTAHRQQITVGRTRDERVEILQGLAAGQRVVHTGHLKLREGQPVTIVEGVVMPEGVKDQ
ncbi:MAG: efflux RND transporter periplasmic adaptor subunit [Gammaproteobacteria bacterium]|nr:MAG: efflux RND transporter periplasmic adaptor subunit [Gammaproteobacteria bacterium]